MLSTSLLFAYSASPALNIEFAYTYECVTNTPCSIINQLTTNDLAMKPRYIIGGAIALAFIGIAALSLDNSKIEYTNLVYAQNSGKRVQVKGSYIKEHGCQYDSQSNTFTFSMRDDNNSTIRVVHNGPKPNNFELAESIVVKGRVENGVMVADHILTKCPSKYEGNGKDVMKQGS